MKGSLPQPNLEGLSGLGLMRFDETYGWAAMSIFYSLFKMP